MNYSREHQIMYSHVLNGHQTSAHCHPLPARGERERGREGGREAGREGGREGGMLEHSEFTGMMTNSLENQVHPQCGTSWPENEAL